MKDSEEAMDLKMKIKLIYQITLLLLIFACMRNNTGVKMSDKIPNNKQFNKLTEAEKHVIINKGTERPYVGKFNNFKGQGTYTCKQCDAPLFTSDAKFDSQSGWPSFDKNIEGKVKRIPESDGRTEIVCVSCNGHLGHIFEGEQFTETNTRHCVNSISLKFIPKENFKKAIFASGCFWGTEYHLQKIEGVIETTVGYTGGQEKDPTYQQVSAKRTGHAEAVEVLYDPTKVSYEQLAKIFFETHDPGQLNRQGPDIGEQYRSEVFVFDDEQRKIINNLIEQLKSKGHKVVTKITDATTFWSGESYHQDYYQKKQSLPYCHIYQKKF